MGHAFARSVMGFGVARFALGLGEAGNFPAAVKTVAEWFPKKERALATGICCTDDNRRLIPKLPVSQLSLSNRRTAHQGEVF